MFRVVLVLFVLAANTVSADTSSQNAKIRVLFTPGDDIASVIVDAIRSAKKQIHVQAYSFSNKAIARALSAAAHRGIDVNILADREQFERGASLLLRDLSQVGADIRLDGEHSAAHNKVIVIDAYSEHGLAITGSYNFTQAAQKYNAENVVLIDDTSIIASFDTNWLRHWKHGATLK